MNTVQNQIIRNLLVGIGALLLAIGCSNDSTDSVRPFASKVSLTLSRYYNAQGTTTLPVWESSSQAGVYVPGSSVASYASPILPGSQTSLFLFSFEGPRQEVSTIVGFWPADAPVFCENGRLQTTIPTLQDGTVSPCLIGKSTGRLDSYEGCEMTLSQIFCVMYISVKKGDYAVREVTVKANGGEAIAGELSVGIDDWAASASEQTITVTLPELLDCSQEAQIIPVMIAPVTLNKGYTATLTDTDGNSFAVSTNDPVELTAGGKYDTDEAASSYATELIFCGDNMIYMINADLADATGYKDAVTWSWDATTAATTLGLAASRCNHLDDCKPVNNGKQILATSSYHWCVLLDVETQQILFHTTSSSNAHSAEILPDDRIVVACSEGTGSTNNVLQLYNIASPNVIVDQVPLTSAHGVVWNEANQRLYAIGEQSLQVYSLKNWDTATPSLELEKTIQTPQNGLHDMTLVNSNTLCIAGKRAYLYDIGADRFTEMTLFSSSTSIKSLNYNDETGELWYTDATHPEGSQSWSTQTIRYATDMNASSETRTIKVPDLDMYKVRVLNW